MLIAHSCMHDLMIWSTAGTSSPTFFLSFLNSFLHPSRSIPATHRPFFILTNQSSFHPYSHNYRLGNFRSQFFLCLVSNPLSRFTRSVSSSRRSLLHVIRTLLPLVLGFLSPTGCSNFQLIESPRSVTLNSCKDAASWNISSVTEVLGVATSHSLELIGIGALVCLDSIGVKVGLELRIRPSIKSAVLYSVCGRCEV